VKRHVDHAADFGIDTERSPSVNFAVTQAAQAEDRRRPRRRHRCDVQGPQGRGVQRCRLARRRATVTVADERRFVGHHQGEHVILASGSVPRTIPGFERGGPIMTSDEVLDLDHVPAASWSSAAARSGASSPPPSPTSAPR
jgi:dihydrolipoamide dehydrogenase